jgi:hypothetical protein
MIDALAPVTALTAALGTETVIIAANRGGPARMITASAPRAALIAVVRTRIAIMLRGSVLSRAGSEGGQ